MQGINCVNRDLKLKVELTSMVGTVLNGKRGQVFGGNALEKSLASFRPGSKSLL